MAVVIVPAEHPALLASLPVSGSDNDNRVLPPVRRGDLLQLLDTDYLFGQGDIWLRVLTVYAICTVRGKPWIFLRGRTIWAPRATKPEHDVLVKSEAILLSRRRG